MLVIFSTYKSM